ncbi:3,4-dihydroxy-2-butanone-4-phosphate synthase [Pseudoclavibacter sp. CFCC 11306]|uniref:3,4-dihydroxy-2-butanone-4-phosphate synthase n=1 Tax=Pseudoclavibacter sp. CFCC 11306 TaxID=1564493 RepID=UPI00130163E7|nr:3,4-dihydroxy-2-butanone-4-phosphate synthase [Pseudoclavibacter sp. CFCC 11306]
MTVTSQTGAPVATSAIDLDRIAVTLRSAVEALRRGLPVLVADDEGRENEGDAIISAAMATPEWIGWMIRHTSGYLCAPMTEELADRLDLPPMVAHNQDPKRTAYTVTVDAAEGVTTGISATDRCRTLNVLADPASTADSVLRPGHIVPLRARDGGVLVRGGHTESGVDLMHLAGLPAVAAIGEMVHDDGEMMRFPDLVLIGAEYGLPVLTVAQIAAWRRAHPENAPMSGLATPGATPSIADQQNMIQHEREQVQA